MLNHPVKMAIGEDDQALMAQARRDPTVFTTLYRRHLDRVYRYLRYRVPTEEDAQDLTTQTFMAALESLSSYRGTGTVAAWLLGIAHHKLIDWRRTIRSTVPLETALSISDPQQAPDQAVLQMLEDQALIDALLQLNPERAEAITLRYFGELSNREVATIMGKNEAAVKMLVHRGLAELRVRCAQLSCAQEGSQ